MARPVDPVHRESVRTALLDAARARVVRDGHERFSLRLVLGVHEGDDEAALLKLLFEALALVQDDALGGHGSRGYGEVQIAIEKVEVRDRAAYTGGAAPAPYAVEVPAALRGKGAAAA